MVTFHFVPHGRPASVADRYYSIAVDTVYGDTDRVRPQQARHAALHATHRVRSTVNRIRVGTGK